MCRRNGRRAPLLAEEGKGPLFRGAAAAQAGPSRATERGKDRHRPARGRPACFEASSLVLGLLLAFFGLASAQTVELYRDHWSFDFIQRLTARGLLSPLEISVGPWLREDLAHGLARCWEHTSRSAPFLGRAEWGLLVQLIGDFSEELGDRGIALPAAAAETHLLSITDSTLRAHIDALLYEDVRSRRGTAYQPAELKSLTTGGILARGSLSRSLWFYLDARNTATRGGEVPKKERFDPGQGLPLITSGKTVYTDQATAYLAGRTRWFGFQAGHGSLWWGPSARGALTLSGNIPPFDFVRLDAKWTRFRFTYLHAGLRSPFGQKYLAAHRIDWLARENLLLSASETVVYGLRGLEWSYLNPVMPYHVAEHHLGDRDNNNLSFDFWWRARPGLAGYGELLIDDLTLSASPLRYWGNKFAFLLGIHWLDPVGIRDSHIRVEYTRIEPYVYTHYDSINRYQHYDQIIGNPLGPNADEWFTEISKYLGRDFRALLWLSRIRKGEGSVARAHTTADGPNKSFLSGIVEKQTTVGCEVRHQIRRDLFVVLRYHQTWMVNLGHQAGRRAHGRSFVASFRLNY